MIVSMVRARNAAPIQEQQRSLEYIIAQLESTKMARPANSILQQMVEEEEANVVE